MLKRKFIISIVFIVLGLLVASGKVNAAETVTSQSTINGVTINWEYTIDENGNIKNLVCKNVTDLSGKVEIPSTIDGKTVETIGSEGFKSAKNITELTIPSSIKAVSSDAFKNCTGITKVVLGNIETIGSNAFMGCTSLTSVEIPKTLTDAGYYYAIFNGCTNLTEITFEDGATTIPSMLCKSTNITKVKIPSSVKSIGAETFKDCANLTEVDLGNIESIGANAFMNCTSLKSVTIPKTLETEFPLYPIFNGCTNLTEITLENGLTVIQSHLCQDTNIKSIEVPETVTNINFEAFKNCKELTKITILDNVKSIDKDAFANHNEDLTIYCYEGSVAAKYAIDNNIKYVYLKRASVEELTATVTYNPTTSTTEKVTATIKTNKPVNKVDGWNLSEDGKTLTKEYSENKTETVNLVDEDGLKKSVEVKISNITTKDEKAKEDTKSDSTNKETTKNDSTVTPKKTLPQTGANLTVVALIGVIALCSLVGYKKIRDYKEIK